MNRIPDHLPLQPVRNSYNRQVAGDHQTTDHTAAEPVVGYGNDRQRLLRQGIQLLSSRPEPSWADWHLAALIHLELFEPDAALRAYQNAVRKAPREPTIRYDYAVLLEKQGLLAQSASELRVLLFLQPDNQAAQKRLKSILQDLATRRVESTRKQNAN
jgi:predicted Zn-dependent protease